MGGGQPRADDRLPAFSTARCRAAAKRFFRKALAQPHTVNPRTLTVNKNPAYPRAVAEIERETRYATFIISGNASI